MASSYFLPILIMAGPSHTVRWHKVAKGLMDPGRLMIGWAGWECFYPSFLDGMPRWLGRPKVVRAAQGGEGAIRWPRDLWA